MAVDGAYRAQGDRMRSKDTSNFPVGRYVHFDDIYQSASSYCKQCVRWSLSGPEGLFADWQITISGKY